MKLVGSDHRALVLVAALVGAGCAIQPHSAQDRAGGPANAEPAGVVAFRIAPGQADVDIKSGTNLSGKTDALLVGMAFEQVRDGSGGGIKIDFYRSDDSLVDGLVGVDSSVESLDAFPHFTLRPSGDLGRFPIRIGPEVKTHSVEFSAATSTSIDWVSMGLAVELEPELDLHRSGSSHLAAYGNVRVGAGTVFISGPLEDYRSSGTHLGAELGLRLRVSGVFLALGFTTRRTAYEESDVVGNSFAEETDFGFDSLFFEFGASW